MTFRWLIVDILLAIILLTAISMWPQDKPPSGFEALERVESSTKCAITWQNTDNKTGEIGGYKVHCSLTLYTHAKGQERWGRTLFDSDLPLPRPATLKEARKAMNTFMADRVPELLKKEGLE